jgi:hypothetical protein
MIWDGGSHEHRLNVLDQCLSHADAVRDVRAISIAQGTHGRVMELMRSGPALNTARGISSDEQWLQIFCGHDTEQGVTDSSTIADYSTAIMALIIALLPRLHTIHLRPETTLRYGLVIPTAVSKLFELARKDRSFLPSLKNIFVSDVSFTDRYQWLPQGIDPILLFDRLQTFGMIGKWNEDLVNRDIRLLGLTNMLAFSSNIQHLKLHGWNGRGGCCGQLIRSSSRLLSFELLDIHNPTRLVPTYRDVLEYLGTHAQSLERIVLDSQRLWDTEDPPRAFEHNWLPIGSFQMFSSLRRLVVLREIFVGKPAVLLPERDEDHKSLLECRVKQNKSHLAKLATYAREVLSTSAELRAGHLSAADWAELTDVFPPQLETLQLVTPEQAENEHYLAKKWMKHFNAGKKSRLPALQKLVVRKRDWSLENFIPPSQN